MKERVGIVGAGIAGLAHAWSAAERGHDVTVFERTPVASGASIRNFGMIWPMGQPDASISIAMLSCQRWRRLAVESGIWVNPCGSLHLAHRGDEWEVLQEFYECQKNSEQGSHLRLLDREAALNRSPAINPDGFLGALFSDLELCINPTEAIREIPAWLEERHSVQFHFETTVLEATTGKLRTSAGETFDFDRIIICSGHDFETLYPIQFRALPIQKCKLQMMRTVAQPSSWKLGPHIAGGLTLRHYSRFSCCASLGSLAQRIATETPELDELGIHVLASQDNYGRIVLGDSHEYGYSVEPFDSRRIDELILRELNKLIRLPTWSMDSHWHGVYAKSFNSIAVLQSPEPNVFICTGLGGSGMTMSFGLAENNWQSWSESCP
jgi:D-hydroxyproline dehydrogenase subunit beta